MSNIKEGNEKINVNVYNGTEPYIFISYSHANTGAVNKILNRLDKERFRLWYDDTMEIGDDFREELKSRIEGCGAFVLFVSKVSMESKYVGMEIITAFKHGKRIYPIYLEADVEIPGVLRMVLENLQHVKGFSDDGDDRFVKKFIESLPVETMHTLQIEDGVLYKCKDGSYEITLPDAVKIIGESAFKHCVRLESITFTDELEVIGDEAFRGCKSLKKLVVPKKVKSIGESAFRDCIELSEIIVENSEIEIGERAFENCPMMETVSLPNGLMEIYGGVFNSCKALEHIELPEKLTILGESAFSSCVKLKEIIIPQNVTKIDDMVFHGCVELDSISMPDSLNKIGKSAFKDCKALVSVRIPANVYSIGTSLFRGCENLKSIWVEPKNRCFKSVDDILFNKNRSLLICFPALKDAEEYEIPDSITVIWDWAFCGAAQLKKILIPDSVSEIGEGAFYKCSALEKIEIPDSVMKIDDVAFRGCTSLKEVVIPENVREFGWGLFNGCENVVVICDDNSAAATYCEKKNIKHRPR